MEIEQITTKGPAFAPAHPGEVLREDVLPALGMPKAAFAEHIGVSRNTLYKLLNEEQPVTLAIAIRLGQALGNGPRFWLNLQMQHDLWIEERKPRVSVGRLTPETIIGKVEGRTSSRIAKVAAPGLKSPAALMPSEIKTISASALTQTSVRKRVTGVKAKRTKTGS